MEPSLAQRLWSSLITVHTVKKLMRARQRPARCGFQITIDSKVEKDGRVLHWPTKVVDNNNGFSTVQVGVIRTEMVSGGQ